MPLPCEGTVRRQLPASRKGCPFSWDQLCSTRTLDGSLQSWEE